jgi:hypothetical protein
LRRIKVLSARCNNAFPISALNGVAPRNWFGILALSIDKEFRP